jgi:GNAT superfamily N-acetyltransferase
MKSNAIIRKASKRDTRTIARIYVTAAREAVDREPEHFRVPTMDEASRLLMPQDSPDAAVLVAEVDGRVAGFVQVLLRRPPEQPSMLKPRLLGYVRELGVSEDARGTGLGSQLLEAAEEWACLGGGTGDDGRYRRQELVGAALLQRTDELSGHRGSSDQAVVLR